MAQSTAAQAFDRIPSAAADEDGLITRAIVILERGVVLPGVLTPIYPNSAADRAAIAAAEQQGMTLIVVSRVDAPPDAPLMEQFFLTGTEAAPGTLTGYGDQPIVLAQGRRRVQVEAVLQTEPAIIVRARPLADIITNPERTDSLKQAVIDLFKHNASFNSGLPDDVVAHILQTEPPGELADLIAATLTLSAGESQTLLATTDVGERLKQVAVLLGREASLIEVKDEIHSHVQDEISRGQRELYLREQMRAIQFELGEDDPLQQEINELHSRIQAARLPHEAHERASKELSRMALMPPMSPEIGVIRTYLDWILGLPWHEQTVDNLDLKHAEKVLEEAHFGLPRIKERVLEHIAVRKLAPDKMKSPILCFVGPPGVGKTSLGKSIAQTLGRRFVRVSLGGVRDEAEIRGHRRTYVGALPGRILQGMARAGTVNPVMMLDEIDKLGADYRGDPSAALLEVLDPEQNHSYADHYLEIPYDLSRVLFITTANDLFPLDNALEDRLEVIEFIGYTEEEKIEIARRFLIPRQLEAHGLAGLRIGFETRAIQTLIREYTYEAGVRNLEREIAHVCRKIARLAAEGRDHPRRITPRRARAYLGPPHHLSARINTEDSVGLATGLVWTSAGGDVQTIEVSVLPGKGSLMMTGQLGDVLQESAQTALSYLRSRARELDIPHDDFESYDVHVHMPEGAVPKDGPSAGITLAAALISAFTERKVRASYAMTGEITLRGKVLPVGGIKEKVLAARRNRIPSVILPADNDRDLTEIPEQALKDLNIILVQDMQQVMDLVLLEAPEQRQRDLDRDEDEDDEDEDDDTPNRQRRTRPEVPHTK